MPPLRLALTCGFVFSVSAFCVGSSRRASLRLRLCFSFWLVSYIFSTLPLPPVVVGGCDSCHSFVFFAWCRVQLNLAQLFVLVLLLGASHASACGICHKYAIGLSISNILWLYLAVRLDEFCHCEQHLQDRWVMPNRTMIWAKTKFGWLSRWKDLYKMMNRLKECINWNKEKLILSGYALSLNRRSLVARFPDLLWL